MFVLSNSKHVVSIEGKRSSMLGQGLWWWSLALMSKVASCFKKFAKRAQIEFEVKLKKIRSDNGKEFDNTNIEAYCDEVGIKHEVSATYTPQ